MDEKTECRSLYFLVSILRGITQFLHPYLLNINYGRNGLWTKRTIAEPECGRNVSKASWIADFLSGLIICHDLMTLVGDA
jgi:hypothetical protein